MTNRRVVTGENEGASFVDYAKDRHVVATPVAPIEEPTGRIEIDAAWVIAPRPLLAGKRQIAGHAWGEKAAAVLQTVAAVDKPAVA